MGCIKAFIVLPMAAFYLPIMPGSEGAYDFVSNPAYFQVFLEESGFFIVGCKAVGKFSSIIVLNAFDCTREGFYQMFYKLSGRIGAVLLKCLYEMPAKIFVNSRILEKLFSNDLRIF